MNQRERMKELIGRLQEAAKAYYQENREIMSNLEYDRLYDELQKLEAETGVVLAGSPSLTVGYEAVDELPKEAHERPMLSLDKTKDKEALKNFIGSQKTLLSWKLDGLTIVLTYRGGELDKAVTRGNGVIGEVVTNNARVFVNLPLKVPYQGELILRGEALITYSDFEEINRTIPEAEARYKNPRNLCSGSVRQLDNRITAARKVRFYAFGLVKADGVDFKNSREKQMEWLKGQGFETVPYHMVTAKDVDREIAWFEQQIVHNDFPSDGLVALYDDIAYGDSLGSTSKFPRNSYAFKWADEIRQTRLLEIEWSPSRTGLINPIAVFEPVELEGTTVSRASVHNISILKELELGAGDEISVYKANMIIPQIAENITRSGFKDLPECCPACGEKTRIQKDREVEVLCCPNPDCPAKAIKSFSLFVSRDALNIDGLSEATLEKWIGRGFLHDFADIFELGRYRKEIVSMEGFGEKSFENLMESIEKARHTTLPRLIYGLGIPNVGAANAKLLCRRFGYDLQRIEMAKEEELCEIEGVGEVIAKAVTSYFSRPKNREILEHLKKHLLLEKPQEEAAQSLSGKTFVITGNVRHFENRSQLKAEIEKYGGKVTGSVSKKTDYLINNDKTSSSAKNQKAQELGVAVISEEDFLEMLKGAD
ncbi:MAG TPA: NAD-dependent DNA ligase LigA [Candidatus Ruminococcus avistercoris]|nr:NAD-dependent DNA ligase LigA [Candidatus Ruminococcus avistercoris]